MLACNKDWKKIPLIPGTSQALGIAESSLGKRLPPEDEDGQSASSNKKLKNQHNIGVGQKDPAPWASPPWLYFHCHHPKHNNLYVL